MADTPITDSSHVSRSVDELTAANKAAIVDSLLQSINTKNGVSNVKDYGAMGDGVTDDAAVIQNALNDGGVVILPYGDYAIESSIAAVANTTLVFMPGATLKKTVGTAALFTCNVANFTVQNMTLDLNSTAYSGAVLTIGTANVRFLGVTTIRNALQGGANTDGGIIAANISGFHADTIYLDTIKQSAVAGLYRGVDFSSSSDINVGQIRQETGDITLNIYASTNVSIGSVVAKNISDNGVYIINATSNVMIDTVQVIGCAEGVVLDSIETDAKVMINDLFVSGASVYGIAYRRGGGYMIGAANLVESSLSTSGTDARNSLTIGNLRILFDTTTTTRPITLNTCDRVTIGSLDVLADSPLGGYAVYTDDISYLNIQAVNISGIGASNLAEGMRFDAASVTAPHITVGSYAASRVTTIYSIQTAITNHDNVFIDHHSVRNKDLLIEGAAAAKLELKSKKTSCIAGDDLGEISIYGSDGSGAGYKFKMLTKAAGGNGALATTTLTNDASFTVAFIPAHAVNSGMTIVLPTSSAGLPVGSLWNNSGTVSIV